MPIQDLGHLVRIKMIFVYLKMILFGNIFHETSYRQMKILDKFSVRFLLEKNKSWNIVYGRSLH